MAVTTSGAAGLTRIRLAATLAGVAILLVAAGAGYAIGLENGRAGMTVRQVTATQVANAMRDDQFYSDFGGNTLVMHGIVQSVGVRGTDEIVEIRNQSSYRTQCDIGPQRPAITPGDKVVVVVEAESAERQANAVLLMRCTLISPSV